MNVQDALDNLQQPWFLLQLEPLAPVYFAPPIWTQLVTALVVGLMTALALQFLLTNLGVAIALSVWRLPFSAKESHQTTEAKSPVSAIAGFGILLTVNLVLFSASFLAATFSQIHTPISGAIVGLVIWSGYFLLLLWLSSTAVTSLVSIFLGVTTAGFRRILSAITALFKQPEDERVTQAQLLAAVRQEVLTTISQLNLQPLVQEQLQHQLQASSHPVEATPLQAALTPSYEPDAAKTVLTAFWQALESFLLNTKAKNLTAKRVDRTLKDLLAELPDYVPVPAFDRTAISAILAQRQDLTDKKTNRLLNQIEATWNTWAPESGAEPEITAEPDLDISEDEARSPVFDTSELSQVVVEAVKDQVMAQLPNLLMQNLPQLAPLALTLTQADVQDSVETVKDLITSNHAKERLEQLASQSQTTIANLSQSVTSEVEKWRDRTTEQLSMIQQETQNQIDGLKQQTQQRVEATRKAAVAAVWWLFAIASTGAIAAGLAGAIAAGFNPFAQI